MIAYIIKFILCSGFLYSFYKLFLERESMYKINRFYLIFSLIFSLIAPLYKIDLPISAKESNISPELLAFLMQNPELLQQQDSFNFGDMLNILYGLIAIILLVRFSYNLYELVFKIKTEERIKDENITYILDLESNQPYSFWKYIFLPKKNIKQLHQNLIDHEKAHCIQKHSFDIILIEVFQILFWFNPFIHFYKKSIKLNHEFLADEYVLQRETDIKSYQHLILDTIATQNPSLMASNFNFILTKKRLLMMTKNTSKRKVKILSFATLPFIFSAFVLFSQKSFAQEVEKSAKKVEQTLDKSVKSQADEIFETANSLQEIIKKKDTITIIKDLSKPGKTVTKQELKEILKSNPTNKIILNDAGEIILNDSIIIKDIVSNTFRIPAINLKEYDNKILNKIDPKDIKTMNVIKKDGLNQIIINDTLIVNMPKTATLKSVTTPNKTFNFRVDPKNNSINNFKVNKKNLSTFIDPKKIIQKDGYSIYIDKNGTEHKINSAEIDTRYLKEIKSDIKLKIDTEKGEVINLSKVENPWTITVEPHSAKNKDYKVEYKYTESPKLSTSTAKPNSLSKTNSYSYSYTYSENPAASIDDKIKELKLREENTKKQIKELEKLQKEQKKNK